MKIISLTDTNNQDAIQNQLVNYVLPFFDESKIEKVILCDYEIERFTADKQVRDSIPNEIMELATKIDSANLLIISLTEDSGTTNSIFNNIYAWLSQIPNRKVLGKKPILLLGTSLKEKGLSNAIDIGLSKFARDKSTVLASFTLPNFKKHFITNEISTIALRIELIRKINHIKQVHFKLYYKDKHFTCGIDVRRGGYHGDLTEY